MPRIPLTWLAEHVDLPAGTTAEQLAADLVRVGLEEEAVHGAAVTGPLVVGRVVERTPEQQKNGKTINWCRVDVGSHNEVADDGTLRPRGIVCGAHNFEVGDLVVVALPGAVLPGPFAIASRRTYGHVSDGMICSAKELDLGEDHDGIIVLSPDDVDAAPGDDAKALLGLGEEVLEINVTPDRGYCFSMRGVAREYGHSTGAAFRDPAVLAEADTRPSTGDGFEVQVEDREPVHGVPGCDRFVAQVVRGVRAHGPSPAWMQRRLTQAGMRPISLAVDVTNYVMLDLGQPLHAYDLAQVSAPIVVRRAGPGEQLRTLDGTLRDLHPEDLLITDSPAQVGRAGRVLGLAGVMGGADSEVTDATTDLLIEAAHFDPVSVARTARRHRIPSEAGRRFERGVDPRLPRVAARRAVELLLQHGGGTADESVTDLDRTAPPTVVDLPLDLPARLVGVPYTTQEVTETLTDIGCSVEVGDGTARVTVPSWRPDLVVPVDLVEEVARLRGYDAIPSVVPQAPAGRGLTRAQLARRGVADALAAAGFVEVLSYPFVGAHQHDALALPSDDARRHAVRLLNPLSDEQPEMRTHLLVTLLETVRRNVGRGLTDLALVETGLVTRPGPAASPAPQLPGGVLPTADQLAALDGAVPPQPRHVAGVLTGLREPAGWWGSGRRADHTDAVEAALLVGRSVGVPLTVSAGAVAPWHPGRTAEVRLPDGTVVGHAGELHPRVVAALELPARTVAFELDLDAVLAVAPTEPVQAVPVSTFPPAKEDIALVVAEDVPVGDLLAAVRAGASSSEAGDLLEELRVFDVYRGAPVPDGHKSVAFSLRLRAADRTLTSAEAAAVRESAVAEAHRRHGASLRA